MIFYETTNADGVKQLAPTQADARAIDRNFTQVDLPTDKPGYMRYVNGLLARIGELEQRLAGAMPFEIEDEPEPEPAAEPVTAEPEPPSSSEQPRNAGVDPAPGSDATEVTGTLNPALLEQQVELLADNPGAGFDALERHMDLTGVGAAFSRGVHILSIVAAGEHQLARMLLGSRTKSRTWGR